MDNGASSYRRFLDGDESGIVEIVKEYKDGLILYLNNYVSNIFIAEELAEDTFVKLLTKRPKDNLKASFKTWLYSIGRNIAIDYLRKNSKVFAISAEDYSKIVIEAESVENSYIKEERKIILHKALSQLKPEYRQILWLIYFENFTNREAAEIMNKSVHNTETLLYRAKKSLKSELEKEGFSYEEL
ncbi:MAG: RNA polymerase sigma factor [Ruminococcaceae bacterium]|nr:RNA polymerase sigma factor [Oscillospiraceae bacterium]